MKELNAILQTFLAIKQSGQPAVLATVVKVTGSTYRRVGARMLITASGQMIGIISGGCLESDVFEHAQLVMDSGLPRVLSYDTTTNDDILWGLGLGCKGVVQVLVECLDGESAFNPLTLMAQWFEHRQQGVLATVFNVYRGGNVAIGSRLICHPDGKTTSNIEETRLVASLLPDIQIVRQSQQSNVKQYDWETGSAEVLLEFVHLPPSLVIFGAGQDVIPVAQFAKALGWRVTVVDCRANELTKKRFAMADTVILSRREVVHKEILIDANTIAVIMTHNYLDDLELLKMLLPSSARYVGLLGSRHRTEQLLQTVEQEAGIGINESLACLHAPIGLDIGADTPEAIALAIIAEIQAVLANRSGEFLRNSQEPIHRQS